jgi:hypothetical protein
MAAAALSPLTTRIAGALTSINTTYLLNTNPMIFDDAQGYCNKMGGHLTSYGSSSEESDVVNYFTSSMGYLLAGNHSLYWLGLRSTVWPNYTWVDMSTDISGYDNWGTGNPDQPGAMCAGGNYTFDPKYSWDDVSCDTNAVFICELLREGRCWRRCMRCRKLAPRCLAMPTCAQRWAAPEPPRRACLAPRREAGVHLDLRGHRQHLHAQHRARKCHGCPELLQ